MNGLGGLIIAIVLIVFLLSNWRRDDSDGAKRSGLIVYTDNKTGVQYLGKVFGALTPRLDKDGRVVTVAEKESQSED